MNVDCEEAMKTYIVETEATIIRRYRVRAENADQIRDDWEWGTLKPVEIMRDEDGDEIVTGIWREPE